MRNPRLKSDKSKNQLHQLRLFGLLLGGAFTLIGLWPLIIYREDIQNWAILLASTLILVALGKPVWLHPLFAVWMKVGNLLGFINTRIILSIGFFLILTPTGLILRMIGKDLLHRQLEPLEVSYRSLRHARIREHMKKQF